MVKQAESNIEQSLVEVPQDSLIVVREPKLVLDEAMKAATCLKAVIDSKPKKIVINGEVYLENEDWLTIARFYGVTSQIVSTRFVEFGQDEWYVRGYEAKAAALLVERNQVISEAESMCLSDEPMWQKKPLFQLRSMAQTRASSRVLRQVFGWVVVLAGYKPTPAEEMVNGSNYLPSDICRDCGEDIRTEKEIVDSKRKYGKVLCVICQRDRASKERAGANRNLEPELKASVLEARRRRPVNGQPITKSLDHTDQEEQLAGD